MKPVLKKLVDLKFGIKVGGGFLTVLVLTGIVGAVGFLTISSLTKSFSVSDSSAQVAANVHAVSLRREDYLRAPGEQTAERVNAELDQLGESLNVLESLAGVDPAAQSGIRDTRDSVAGFSGVFDEVVEKTNQQNAALSSLKRHTSDLEQLAFSIREGVAAETELVRKTAEQAVSDLDGANLLLRKLILFKEKADEVRVTFLAQKGDLNREELARINKALKSLSKDAKKLRFAVVSGIDQSDLGAVSRKTEAEKRSFAKLTKAIGTKNVQAAQSAAQQAIRDLRDTTDGVRTLTLAVVDDAQGVARESARRLEEIQQVAKKAELLNNLALATRAETLDLFSRDDDEAPTVVVDLIGQLASLDIEIQQDGDVLPSASEDIAKIAASVQAIDLSLDRMVAIRDELQSRRKQLDTYMSSVTGNIEALAVAQSRTANRAADNAKLQISITVLLAILGGVALVWGLNRVITRPIQQTTSVMRRLAEGDNEVGLQGLERGDELGEMNRTVQVFRDNAIERARLREQTAAEERNRHERQLRVEGLIEAFRASVGDALTSAERTADGLNETAQTLTEIASDSSGSAAETRQSSSEMTSNVQAVASAAEELAASIEEISRQVSQTSGVVEEATNSAQDTNSKVESLAQSASRIGEVVTLIQAIAEQTNLLALNATIEAARAGDAGKGFAVVAAEVKGLANQTSKATEEISSQIAEIQAATVESVEAISRISKTMAAVNEYTASIASAVDQQGAATAEISQNIQQAAAGTNTVSRSIDQLSGAVEETSASADMVLTASGELNEKNEKLKSEVANFLKDVAQA